MANWLEHSSLVLKVKVQNTACARDLSKTISILAARNGYPALFRAGEGEGGEEEEWRPT